ncbi:MAG: hypothetical protein IKN12_06600 [Selenomonadaceae bacterium]|nr:hypothetical protein [Selenomonadaceae bacterium]
MNVNKESHRRFGPSRPLLLVKLERDGRYLITLLSLETTLDWRYFNREATPIKTSSIASVSIAIS